MLQIVEDREVIDKAEEELRNSLDSFEERKDPILLGGLGWHKTREAHWSKELGMWWAYYTVGDRFENAFGVQEPRWDSHYGHSISCVIDVPFEGINRRISGAFATDDEEMFLLHRGKIGGGRKGIGKSMFFCNYTSDLYSVQDGNVCSIVALVGDLDSKRFPIQVANFVHTLQQIKDDYSSGARYSTPPSVETFKEEFTGKKAYTIGQVKAECDHGLVVKELAEILKSKGFRIANRRPIDLYNIGTNGDINSIFEVKTDSETTDFHTAIGQLMDYSSGMRKRPKLFAVFPETLDARFKEVLEEIGIQLILYKWENDTPLFSHFDIQL